MSKPVSTLLILSLVLISCSAYRKENVILEKAISEVFAYEDIEIVRGISTGSKGEKHPYVEVTLTNGIYRNGEPFDEMMDAGSMAAVIVFENFGTDQVPVDLTIDINMIRNENDSEKTYSLSYPAGVVRNAILDINTSDSLFRLMGRNDFAAAFDMFDTSFQMKTNIETFKEKLMNATLRMGSYEMYQLKGFELVDSEVNGKQRGMIKIKFIVSVHNNQRVELFFDRSDEQSKVFGLRM